MNRDGFALSVAYVKPQFAAKCLTRKSGQGFAAHSNASVNLLWWRIIRQRQEKDAEKDPESVRKKHGRLPEGDIAKAGRVSHLCGGEGVKNVLKNEFDIANGIGELPQRQRAWGREIQKLKGRNERRVKHGMAV